MGEKMERGTETLKKKLQNVSTLEIRHARRGWCQECLCCITKSSFKYYSEGKKVAESKEEFNFCCRCCCAPHHTFDMVVKAPHSEDELIEINRPYKMCSLCPAKPCCRQETVVFSGEADLGEIQETCWFCVPQYKVLNHDDEVVYIIHPPTCCGGCCIDFFTEGNPCPHCCCLVPCRIYTAGATSTNGSAPYIGKMRKIPKEKCCDVWHEINYWELQFPDNATTDQKGLLLGSSLLINSLFYEGSE